MKLFHIPIISIILILAPGPVFGTGQTDIHILVPGDSVAVIHGDVDENLNTPIAPALLNLFYLFRDGSLSEKPPKDFLDQELTGVFGINSKEIKKVTLFLLSFDTTLKIPPAGIHFVCKEGVVDKINQHIQNTYSFDTGSYKKIPYLFFSIYSQTMYVHTAGENLFLSFDSSTMEKIFDVMYGGDSVRNNQDLYKLLSQNKEQTFYAVGSVPEKLHTPLPAPFEPVREFVLTISLGEDISFICKARLDNEGAAEDFIISVKGSIALTGMVILAKNKDTYPILEALIENLAYEQKGSYAYISGTFTEEDLKNFINLAPVLFMMM